MRIPSVPLPSGVFSSRQVFVGIFFRELDDSCPTALSLTFLLGSFLFLLFLLVVWVVVFSVFVGLVGIKLAWDGWRATPESD